MCGFFYSQNLEPPQRCIDVVSHRGPDASSWERHRINGITVRLGHRRLKIIDRSDDANQPMEMADSSLKILFNGMIFNYLELRRDLKKMGFTFRTNSDTEVLLCAWAAWGSDCLEKIDGMFAGVIVDMKEMTVTAFRDRFGIKPLYWSLVNNGLAIASEIKQILEISAFPRASNPKAIHDFLVAGVSDCGTDTFFKHVNRLPAGHFMIVPISKDVEKVRVTRWYSSTTNVLNDPLDRAAGSFRKNLAHAVETHLRSDAPLGFYLSGGLDSSAIVALAAENEFRDSNPLNTFTAVVEHATLNEKPWAEMVVHHMNATPHWVSPAFENFDSEFRKLSWHMDEPIASASPIAQWHVNKAVEKLGIRVMLDGQGADELLAGYHSFYLNYYIDLIKQFNFIGVIRLWATRRKYARQNDYSLVKSALIACLRNTALGPLITAYWKRKTRKRSPWPWLKNGFLNLHALNGEVGNVNIGQDTGISGVVEQCRFLTFSGNLPKLLRYQDRSAMAHSIEARLPFLEKDVAEFILSLPRSHRIDGACTKIILRKAMADKLPAEIIERRDKVGFALPFPVRSSIEFETALRQYCDKAFEYFPETFDRSVSQEMIERVFLRTASMTEQNAFWRIASLGCWADVFKVDSHPA